MAADTLVSVGVVVSGVIISFTGWFILDPLIGIIIVIVIFISTWGLLKDSVRLSLDGVPLGIDSKEIASEICSVDNRIIEVHHLHIWALSTTENALTAHISLNDIKESESVKQIVKEMLKRHNIAHATLEFETADTICKESCDCL